MKTLGVPSRAFLGTIFYAFAAFTGCDTRETVSSNEQALLEGCKTAKDCEDGDPCTNNVCTANVCLPPVPVLGCDPSAGGEGGAPTVSGGGTNLGGTQSAVAGTSSSGGTLGSIACSDDRECADGDACTSNLCVLDICVTLPVSDCTLGAGGEPAIDLSCDKDEACEDGHPCTDNKCVAGLCATLPVLGCCFRGNCVVGVGGSTQVEIGGTSNGGSGRGGSGNAGIGAGGDGNAAGEGTTSAGGHDDAPSVQTQWALQGGSCSVSSRPSGGLGLLLLLGLVAVARRRRASAAFAAGLSLFVVGRAQAAGFAQDAFTAPAAPDDLMWTERAAADSGQLRPFARLTLGFSDDPLVLVDANDSRRELRVVDDQFAAYGAFGIGFFHRAHLALLMPLYVQSSSFAQLQGNIEGTKPGDLGIDGRFTILDRRAPFELALAATVRLPTGDRDSYASDGSVTAWPRALLSKQVSAAGSLVALSAGPMFRPHNQELGVATGTQLRFGAGALIALTRVVGITAEAAGSTVPSDAAKRNTPLEGALGGRLTFSSLVLGSTIGTGLTSGVGAPDLRWLALLALPGPFSEPAPEAPSEPAGEGDDDHDGIANAVDRCPQRAEDQDGFDDRDGCPDEDDDHDGIVDSADKCPREAEDQDAFEDHDGCPDADNDRDGLNDKDDKCPSQAEDMDQWEDQDGCPDADNDSDGVLDPQDVCPNEPETKNGIDDDDGCPDLIRVEQGQIRTLEPIYFDYNKATIQARSEALLLEMGNLIRTRPDLGVIAVEGHTDNKGSAKYNLKLSKDRAASVRAFLTNVGVPENRLTSDGFGSERPLEENKTEAGRAKNRRVEFHFAPASATKAP